ncbi:PLP-dependent cysteine synthase family protein [Acidaminobacterium chupaoyuni]
MEIFDNITQLACHTPLLRLNKLSQRYGCKTLLLAKLESWNPSGSVKDRSVLFMLKQAMQEGKLPPGGTVIDAGGGNAAVSLAMTCAALSLKAIIVVPDSIEKEFQVLLRTYGAKVVTVPAKEGMAGATAMAEKLYAEQENAFIPHQFENDAACEAHRVATGPEILEALPQVDYFIAGVGTGATLTGCGEFLKSRCMDCRVIAVEPYDSPVLSGGFPSPHSLRGLGAGFVPDILNTQLIDEIIQVRTPDAVELAGELCRTEGLLCGLSSGAALAAAVSIASRPEAQGKNLVVILPDAGERYLYADASSNSK